MRVHDVYVGCVLLHIHTTYHTSNNIVVRVVVWGGR